MSKNDHDIYIEEMKKELHIALEFYVNGKIDKMSDKFDAYIINDEKWKAMADPYIRLAMNISGTWKFIVYVVVSVLSFLGLYKILN